MIDPTSLCVMYIYTQSGLAIFIHVGYLCDNIGTSNHKYYQNHLTTNMTNCKQGVATVVATRYSLSGIDQWEVTKCRLVLAWFLGTKACVAATHLNKRWARRLLP